ncbi:MAG: peptidylprolyl isomerase [Candidatus Cloacimonetes bacterium]|nr:peptidylprolyl isomerase [Candidatus Cloacimonadota bacterium]
MLEDLRKNQKFIIWIIAIVFIVSMALMGIMDIFQKKPVVGKIYGKKILYNEYDQMFRQNVEMYLAQNPDAQLDENLTKSLNEQTWNQLVSRTVMQRQIKNYRIKVSDKDIINKFKNDPPQEIQQNPGFMTDGKFDKQKYLSAIATDEYFAQQLEQYIRELLPYEKLERKIKDQVVVTEDSVRIDWIEKNDKASGKVIFFDYNKIPAQEINDADIQSYYDNNKEKYRKDPARKYRYVQLKLEASPDDITLAKEEIDYVNSLILSGQDFGTLAEQYSQDPGSASKQGSLGYFGKGRMVPEFEEKAFSMNVGDISEPFKTNFGWHILKVTNTKTNDKGEKEVEASHILIKIEPSDKTKMDLRNLADDIYTLVKEKDFENAIADHELEIKETAEFNETTEYIPGIGRYPHLVKEAFSEKIGFMPEPVKTYDGSYIIAELSYKVGSHIQEFDKVKEVIKRELDKNKRIELAYNKANEILSNNPVEDYFKKAEEAGFSIVDFKDITISKSIPQIGLDKQLNQAIFAIEANNWAKLIKSDKGAYMAFVENRTHADMEGFNSKKDELTEEYRQRKEQAHYSEWYQKVLKEAKTEDLRYLYY